MLGKPLHGWTDVTVGGESLGTASYLEDIPMDLLDAFIHYFSKGNALPFGYMFDAEGSEFGIVQIDCDVYTVKYENKEFDAENNDDISETSLRGLKLTAIDYETYGLDRFAMAKDVIKKLAEEFVSDIQENLSDWVEWELIECSDDAIKQEREAEMKKKINKLKRLIRTPRTRKKKAEEAMERVENSEDKGEKENAGA